ncbi:MAG: DUF799 domain-containing protein [Candidatus Syntrophosphaera sp.]|nr:DUF799 domain-containing protein [Candidatus Syntrophosphaera sp.]
MRKVFIFTPILLLFALSGCLQVTKTNLAETYPAMYSDPPLTILILPPVNNTTAADAKEYFACSLSEALGLRGYHPLPVEAMFGILRDEGLYDSETVNPAVLANLKKHFGADAVLYSTINKWDKSWFLTSGTLTIDAEFALLSTASAETIWDYSVTTIVNLGSSSKNLLEAALESAIKTAISDYFPYARTANIRTFREALPLGKHHPEAGTDGLTEIGPEKHGVIRIDR